MSRNFFTVAITILLVATVAATLPNASQEPGAGSKDRGQPAPQSHVVAKKIFMRDCAICHGENGNGQTDLARDMQLPVSDWTAAKALADKSDGNLFTLIRNGKDKMPPEGEDRAKDEEVRGLILYIRDFSKSQPATASQS